MTVQKSARSQRVEVETGTTGRRYRFQMRARFGTRSNGFAGKKATIYGTSGGSTVAAVPGQPRNLFHEFIGDIVHLTWTAATQGGSELLRWEVGIGPTGQWRSTTVRGQAGLTDPMTPERGGGITCVESTGTEPAPRA